MERRRENFLKALAKRGQRGGQLSQERGIPQEETGKGGGKKRVSDERGTKVQQRGGRRNRSGDTWMDIGEPNTKRAAKSGGKEAGGTRSSQTRAKGKHIALFSGKRRGRCHRERPLGPQKNRGKRTTATGNEQTERDSCERKGREG